MEVLLVNNDIILYRKIWHKNAITTLSSEDTG